MRTSSWLTLTLALAPAPLLAQVSAAPAQRAITGRVQEGGSGEPLALARVTVDGQPGSVQTDDLGRFRLQVPAGEVRLMVARIGHAPATVVLGATDTSATIRLNRVALNLDAVVVSGHATSVPRKHLGTSVTVLDNQDMTRVSHQTIEHSLQGKIAGAQINQRTGAPGGGNMLRLRGISTVLGGTTTPLYVVDGVIVADLAVGNAQSIVTQGQNSESPANRITDLSPGEIEQVEILKGSAAAAIYGSKASAGVVLITTRRGEQGRPRWSVRQGFGTSALAFRNGQRQWSYDDAIAYFGARAADYFDPITHEPFVTLDYEDLAYGERPLNWDLSLNLSGGANDTRYFLSGAARDELGIVANSGARKYSLRANLDQVVGSRNLVQLNIGGTHSSSDRAIFDNENGPAGIGSSVGYNIPSIPSFLDLRQRPDGSWPVNPFRNTNPLQNIALARNHDDVWRGIAGGQLRTTLVESPQHDVRAVVVGGLDVLMQRYDVFTPPELQSEAVLTTPGRAVVNEHRTLMSNLNVNLVHAWRPSSRISLTTQVGTQYERWNQSQLAASRSNLAGGLEVVNAGASATTIVNDFRLRVEDFGVFAQSEWLMDETLLLAIGGRWDRSSANADVGQFFFYPKASLSWSPRRVIIPLANAQVPSWLVSKLKLRAAYGATGNRPWWSDKYVNLAQGTVGGQTWYRPTTTLKPRDMRPERQEELEGGIDVSLLDERASIEFTAFTRDVSDLLLSTSAPAPSSGFTSRFANGGTLRLTGVELAATMFPVRTGRMLWTTRATFGQNRSRVLDLNGDTLLTFGSTPVRGQIWLQPGHSATRLMGTDTLPTFPTVTYLGDGAPRWTGGLSNEIRLGGGVSLYVLFDHQRGGRLWSGTMNLYDNNRNARDHDVLTATGEKLGDVRRAANAMVASNLNQDVTYTKLREVTVGWDLPQALANQLRASRGARVTLSGRNLVTWTGFRGGDPEAENFFGGFALQPLQHNRELAAYPASRQVWLTFQLEY